MQAGAPAPVLDQEFDSGNLYALRAAVQAHAGQAGLSEDRASEVVLAVHELAANAIAHGAGHGRLRLWDLAGALSCEIADGGGARGHRVPLTRQFRDPRPLRTRGRPPRATACGWCGRWPITWTCAQGPAEPGPLSPSRFRRRIVTGGREILDAPLSCWEEKGEPRPTTGERAGAGGSGVGQAWRSRSLSSASMSM